MAGHWCVGQPHRHSKLRENLVSRQASARMRFAFWINFIFALIELAGGFLTNSMAIISDALHDFGDSLVIGLSWWLERKSRLGPDAEYSYGHRRYSVLGAAIAALIILISCILIFIFSVPRLFDPQPIIAEGMLALAILGVVVNFASFWRLHGNGGLHEKILKWHFVEDMVGWVSVLLAALLIWLEERLTFLDPLLSMVIAIWIFSRVYKPFRATLDIFLQSFPAAISKDALETSLKAFADVDSVHHLHLWSIDENSHVLTAHILVKRALSIPELGKLKKDIKAFLKNNFGILDTTIEIEFPGQECSDPEHSSEF